MWSVGSPVVRSSDPDDCIKVIVRVRPLGGGSGTAAEVSRCIAIKGSSELELNSDPPKKFTFDAVRDESSTQEELFSQTGKRVVDSCLQGYNGTIFA